MDKKDLIRRFGWTVYLLLFVLGIAIYFGREILVRDQSFQDFLLNIASELVVVTLIFFLVNQFLQWDPERWQQKGNEQLATQLETALERVLKLEAGSGTSYQFVLGYDENYRGIIGPLQSAKDRIRVSACHSIHSPSPDYYLDKFNETLAHSKQLGKPIRVDLVFGAECYLTPDKVHGAVYWAKQELAKKDVVELVSFHVVNLTWGFDLLIVDNQHLAMAFPYLRGQREHRRGLLFEDQPELVRNIADWFDDFLLKEAVTYEEFCQEYPKPDSPGPPPWTSE